MKNTFNSVEDFLTDESFRDWVKKPTPERNAYWNAWMDSNREKADLVKQAQKTIRSLTFEQYYPDTASKERIFGKILQETRPRRRYLPLIGTWYRVAAVLIVVIGIGFLAYIIDSSRNSTDAVLVDNDTIQKTNPIGKRSQHTLPDGSVVYLNSGSTIQYPKSFDSEARLVTLEGEAFFEVVKDNGKPFKVSTGAFEVMVLGTTFNVNTIRRSSTVALVEGKVKVTAKISDNSLELSPGQMALFDEKEGTFTPTPFDIAYITGWTDGYLTFRGASLDEVVEKLHQWYGVTVSVSNRSKSKGWSYTANFKDETLENVLLNMSTLRNFDYVIKGDTLLISF